MDYEATTTLKDGTVVRSYHPTPKMARDWLRRVEAGFEAKENEGAVRDERPEAAESGPIGR